MMVDKTISKTCLTFAAMVRVRGLVALFATKLQMLRVKAASQHHQAKQHHIIVWIKMVMVMMTRMINGFFQ